MPRLAVDSDAVFTILPSLESVEATILGEGGLIETAPRDCTLIQMSTISPELTRRLAAAALAGGLGFLDTPMSGTSAMVERGDCVIFVAGDRARAEACQLIFDAIAKKTHYVGDAGMASLAKLATNLLVGLNTAALAEALVLGAKGGLAPGVLVEILKESAGASKMVDVRGPLMVSRRFDAQMKVDLFLKDFKLMLEEGQRLGVSVAADKNHAAASHSHRHGWTRQRRSGCHHHDFRTVGRIGNGSFIGVSGHRSSKFQVQSSKKNTVSS